MAGGFPFSSVPWHTTNAAKFVGNVGLGPLAKSATPNCSLKCNCEAGFDAFTDRSKATDSRYWESDDSSGVEVRRCFDPSFSSVAGYQLAGDLSKCSNNSATATTLGSVFNSSHSTGPNCIRCEEQRPALDAKISASSRQNPSILAVHSLHDGRTCPKYGSESKTSNPTQKVSLEFKPDSIDNVYYPTMLSKSSGDLDFGFLRGAKSREPEVEIYGKDRAAFPKSINESRLQEGYPSGDVRCDNYNKIQENGKVSKRKAGKMERNEMVADVHSGRNVDEDSRILRVSRLTGGKDRHSKVLTAKGIRDRRVRLSVRTAIQFYDLQDRLGFEQPSKAVDWLIHTARSAIEELPVLDAEMSASAGNLTRLISSNSSHLEHCVASPRHSATTAAAASPFRFGLASLEGEGTSFRNTINEKVIPIVTLRDLDTARSGSSISNGSIKESLEHYTSNSSMSKPSSRVESRLEARERARKKLTSAKISDRSLSAIGQLKPMQPSLSSQLKGVFPYTTVPVASQCIKDYPCGIHTQDLSITESVQPLWDYNMPPYTGNLFTAQDFQPLQNMATLGLPSIQNCFRPVSSTADSIRVIGSSSLQSYEMPDSAIPLSDEKQIRHFRSNTE